MMSQKYFLLHHCRFFIPKKKELMVMKTVSEIFGSMVFGDEAMKQYLPKETYKRLQETIKNGSRLDTSVADEVASAMKN